MRQEKLPGKLLRQLAEKSLLTANERPLKKNTVEAWSGIGFSLCGQKMVAPMGEVVEIINVPNVTFVPGVKEWMLGIANVRGRLLPVVDLERFFGARLTGNRNSHRVLIVEVGNSYVGLVVSKVFGLKHFAANTFDEEYSETRDLFSRIIDGKGGDGESSWLRFKPARLVKDEHFSDASSFGSMTSAGNAA